MNPIKKSSQFIDLQISNIDKPTLLASYSANLNREVVEKGANWDLSCVRLKCPLALIPLSTRFLDNQFNVSISVGLDATNPLNYVTSFLLNSYIQNGSQYIQNYQDYITCINLAFSNAFDTLLIQQGGSLSSTQPPIITLDPVTNLMSLIIQDTYSGDNLYVWFNQNTISKFIFPAISARPTNPIDQQFVPSTLLPPLCLVPVNDYLISINLTAVPFPSISKKNINALPATLYYITIQDSSSLANFNTLESIVLATNTIPVGQQISVSNLDGLNNSQQNFYSVITDFEVSQGSVIDRGYVYYSSQGYTRRYNIISNASFTKLDVQFLFKTTTGLYYPIFIPIMSNATVLLEIRRIYGDYITTN